MSGHSHFATIKRQKETKDAARGKIFSKMAKEIAIAVKAGGNPDPNFNYHLRMVLDKARSYNMPKINVDRAISSAASNEALEEIVYEGFGPSGVQVMVYAATDNRNRTAQAIKNAFERGGGSLAGPGAVSFNFENKGYLLVEKKGDSQTQMLDLIDLGAEDVEESDDGIEVYVSPEGLSALREKVEQKGFVVKEADLFMKAKSYQTISNSEQATKVLKFMEDMDDQEDVQKVFSNLDIPDAIK
jgi:YebC/PmpR family DNA-binding regulatory protein